jgi:DNA (cytosine-5)-methyltransferase 1
MKQFEISKPIRLIELFAGIGAQSMALRDLGAIFEHYRAVEIDKFAMASYNAIHGTNFEVSDIRNLRGGDLGIEHIDRFTYLLTYSFP